jgi:hypothetical protein
MMLDAESKFLPLEQVGKVNKTIDDVTVELAIERTRVRSAEKMVEESLSTIEQTSYATHRGLTIS